MAREFFRFGTASKKFSDQNEKILAPLFQETRTAIGGFLVPISKMSASQTSRQRKKQGLKVEQAIV
nr:hypothetical protein [Porphyromonas gulae]